MFDSLKWIIQFCGAIGFVRCQLQQPEALSEQVLEVALVMADASELT
jgi:hypothetical protein